MAEIDQGTFQLFLNGGNEVVGWVWSSGDACTKHIEAWALGDEYTPPGAAHTTVDLKFVKVNGVNPGDVAAFRAHLQQIGFSYTCLMVHDVTQG